jgi:NADH-quinone oxidoreductase subunit E
MRIQRISIENKISTKNNKIDLSLLDPIIEKYKTKKGSTIPLLQATQQLFGYIPKEAFEYISKKTDLKASELYGVATFYAQFRLKPVGKHIVKICHGTACHVQGVKTITESILDTLQIKDGETTSDGFYTVESVACLGCCSLAPVIMIDEEVYGKLTSKTAINIIKEIQLKENN